MIDWVSKFLFRRRMVEDALKLELQNAKDQIVALQQTTAVLANEVTNQKAFISEMADTGIAMQMELDEKDRRIADLTSKNNKMFAIIMDYGRNDYILLNKGLWGKNITVLRDEDM